MSAGAHRYWAVAPKNRDNGWVALSEIEMRTSIGGGDVTGSGTASGPANMYVTGSVDILFDNDAGNIWAINGGTKDEAKIVYDFGSPVAVVEVAVTTSDYGGGVPKQIYVYWSDDSVTWTMVAPGYNGVLTTPSTVVISDLTDLVLTAGGQLVNLAPGWPTEPFTLRAVDSIGRYDTLDGGVKSIMGDVAIDDSPDIPVSRKVRLYEKAGGRLIRETWSKPDGTYEFHGLKDQKYFLVSHDDRLEYNAAVKDEITPV